jgi:hypothetical protein
MKSCLLLSFSWWMDWLFLSFFLSRVENLACALVRCASCPAPYTFSQTEVVSVEWKELCLLVERLCSVRPILTCFWNVIILVLMECDEEPFSLLPLFSFWHYSFW